ncbi:hypothetical protein [Streptomyces angustmyceticus]|uniref:hypothetical protein n=1 Tax=Streptomyces angustmyceticus TaxID=285578 RepID=UPI00344D63B3
MEHLPPTSATARAAAGHHWQHGDWMLADLVDLMARHFTAFLNANRAEKASPVPYPDAVWRPGDPTPEQKAKADRKRHRAARTAYQEIVAQATPQYAEKG